MPKATEKIELTDAQVVKNAWRLIRSTDVKDSLPPRHTLSDIWRASRQVQNLGLLLWGSQDALAITTAFQKTWLREKSILIALWSKTN